MLESSNKLRFNERKRTKANYASLFCTKLKETHREMVRRVTEVLAEHICPVCLAYQPPVRILFSQNKPTTNHRSVVLFSHNKPTPATNQTNRLIN
jgi:hypothetical protein